MFFYSIVFLFCIAGPHPLARLLGGRILYAFYGEPARPARRRAVVLLAGDAGQQQRAEPRGLVRPLPCRFSFRSARRAPVICSPALLRRPGEQITSARARHASPCLYGGFFFRSTGRGVPSSAPAESDLTFAGSGQIRFSLRFGLLLLPSVKRQGSPLSARPAPASFRRFSDFRKLQSKNLLQSAPAARPLQARWWARLLSARPAAPFG